MMFFMGNPAEVIRVGATAQGVLDAADLDRGGRPGGAGQFPERFPGGRIQPGIGQRQPSDCAVLRRSGSVHGRNESRIDQQFVLLSLFLVSS
jgi:hypothetical protein